MVNIDIAHQILDLIEQHGLSVVLLVGSLLAWVLAARWLGKKFDEIWNVFKIIRNDAINPDKERVEFVVKLNVQVRSLLREAMASCGCGWVQLWQFHNGVRGLGRGRIPFLYISLTHEVYRSGLSEMREEFAHLPLAMFDYFGIALIEREIVIHNNETTNPDGVVTGMGKMMKKYGADTSAMRVIRDEEGEIIGFMSFIFTESVTIDQVARNKIFEYSQRMTALLASLNEGETLYA